ncbi:MAG TPA: YdcF family protein [Gaiellaceae bacterium]|nr:YdcF family protein [Gaiellaceae bacterium]
MLRVLLTIASPLVAALAVLSVPLFILYDDDEVTNADAVMVLAGNRSRLPVALDLVERGAAPVLVISDGLDPRWTTANRLCRFGGPVRIVCPRPDPYSTRGEARLAARLARERGWRSLIVVSSRFHLFRARKLFQRCFRGKLSLVGAPNPGLRLPLAIAFEWGKLGVTTVRRGC